ncbi:hypothetical protein [Roseivirga misakiensis]|uniref:Uncharacterized protein n=1 Tax=Roseivirga misakiensis TaxID=1563681 RepID=A0A1E5SKG7_9BACT|nr:hypothetical protein [Roseivirga misakiensis]OEJ99536.1 hypothetical protein BFP71_08125 [Roseivirga misakiensis]
MAEFSDWFKETFKNCYCEQGNLIDEKRFAEIVQLVLDNEADEESRAIFEEKIKSCVKSNFTFENEKSMREEIQKKLSAHTGEIPTDLAQTIRNSVNL